MPTWSNMKLATKLFFHNHPVLAYGGSAAVIVAAGYYGLFRGVGNSSDIAPSHSQVPPFGNMPNVPTLSQGEYYGGLHPADPAELKLKSYDPVTGLMKFEKDPRTFAPYKTKDGRYELGVVTGLEFPVGPNQQVTDSPITRYVPQTNDLEKRAATKHNLQ